MPIKKLRVSFDIDADMFTRMLAAGHSDMNIQVFSTEDPRVTNTEPKQITSRLGMRKCILMQLHSERRRLHEIRLAIVEAGYSVKSLNNCLALMIEDGLVRRAGYGIFAITAKGRRA